MNAPSPDTIFNVNSPEEFNAIALDVFTFQYKNNKIYNDFCKHLGKQIDTIQHYSEIPFLPIEFFKSKQIISNSKLPEITFTSSGTTGLATSKHHVTDLNIYKESYTKAFQHFYDNIADYCILALLPSYLERNGSSLIYMANDFIAKSKHPDSGFYLDEIDALVHKLKVLNEAGQKVFLLGVSFALLDLAENHQLNLNHTIVMETGGMKGRRKEMIRAELHQTLQNGLGVSQIHSEYGMTELLSQAYSQGNGLFKTPPWMKILIRDTEDPLTLLPHQKTGGVNVIDLANVNSCSFIATQDLGKMHSNESFEILGRFDNSDIRGCNLMVV